MPLRIKLTGETPILPRLQKIRHRNGEKEHVSVHREEQEIHHKVTKVRALFFLVTFVPWWR